MKVLFFSTYYPYYLESLYKRNSNLSSRGYAEQMEFIRNDFFGSYTSYIYYLEKLGVEACLVIPNCKPLQLAWAKENNVEFREDSWQFDLPLKQIRKYSPDIFFMASMFEYYGPFLDEVKKTVRNVFGWISCEIPKGQRLNQMEYLLTSVPSFADNFRKLGIPSDFINASFDPRILEKLGSAKHQDIPFSFVGSLSRSHTRRIEMVRELMENTEMAFFGTGITHLVKNENLVRKYYEKIKYKLRSRGQVWGLDMYKTLRRSRITFNSHIDSSGEFVGNMRTFEATGVGTLLLTDGKNAPMQYFTGDEVVYYESLQDALDKVEYYLEHEEERSRIAANGQKRTLKDYNSEIATRKLYDFFLQRMK